MSALEKYTANQEDLERILNTPPPIPVGVDLEMQQFIRDHSQDSITGENIHPGYAFTGIPNFIEAARSVVSTIPKDRPVVCLDIGSSVPVYSEHRRALHFSECGYTAKEFYNRFYQDEDAVKRLRTTNGDMWRLLGVLNANRKLPGEQTSAMDFFMSSVQEAIYCMTQDEYSSDAKLKQSLRDRFIRKDRLSAYTYPDRYPDSPLDVKKGVAPDVTQEDQKLVDVLAKLEIPTERALKARQDLKNSDDNRIDDVVKETRPAGEPLAEGLLELFVDNLAEYIKSEYRTRVTRFISSDQANPDEILRSVPMAFSEEVLASYSLSRAMASMKDPNRHFRSSFEDVSLSKGSLSLLTAFDSWPRFINGPNVRKQVKEGLSRAYNLLQPGGLAYFLPWFVESQRDGAVDDRHIIPASDVMYGAIDFQIDKETLSFNLGPAPKELLTRWKLGDDLKIATSQYGDHPEIAFYMASLQKRQNRRSKRYS